MKIRTKDELIHAIDSDLIWRRKELSQFKTLLEASASRGDRMTAILRSAVPLLYAHWEGFVKTAASAYLEFVAAQRLSHEHLAPPLLALAVRKILAPASGARRIHAHIEVTRFFLDRLSTRSAIPWKDGISTRANLSSDVLREITETLGVDFRPYETKCRLIDESLVQLRNTVAHGEYILVDEQRYRELSKSVDEMMDTFRDQLQNAVILDAFRR